MGHRAPGWIAYRGELERVAEALLTRETLGQQEFNALLGDEG